MPIERPICKVEECGNLGARKGKRGYRNVCASHKKAIHYKKVVASKKQSIAAQAKNEAEKMVGYRGLTVQKMLRNMK